MRLTALCLLTLVTPGTAGAQLPILEGLFKKVTDVNLFGTIAWFANRPHALAGSMDDGEPRAGTLTGLGFEVSFDIGEFSPRKKEPGDTGQAKPEAEIDTLEVRERKPDGSFLIYKPVPKKSADRDNRWGAELAIGYTEIRDFVSARSDLDVRGAVREFPSVSLYFSHLPAVKNDNDNFRYYVGVRTGLAQLQGLRGYVGDSTDGVADLIYNGGGTTFQFGLLAGIVYAVGPVHVFVEPAYTRRRFSGVEWSGISGTIEDVLPRSLDMSTWSVSMGTQLEIGAAAGEK